MKKNNTKLFGTDGIRENGNSPIFSPENMFMLGLILGDLCLDTHNKIIFIAKDTRASGDLIEKSLSEGIIAAGIDVAYLGIMPTPVLAYLTKKHDASFGIEISASHNPACDNGIKIFNNLGFKLDSSLEKLIEQKFHEKIAIKSNKLGQLKTANGLSKEYKNYILKKFPTKLNKLKLVIDCAHGAAFNLAQEIFTNLQAQVSFIGISPDGHNINFNCGSQAPEALKNAVLAHKADLGIAFDGDADRCLFISHDGKIVSGDAIIALLAIALKNRGELYKHTLVASIMSSISLDKNLAEHGIKVKRAPVGDKYVAQLMQKEQATFGGENSGHLIYVPHSTTGDGILASLLLISILIEQKKPLAQLIADFKEDNQVLRNIGIRKKIPLSKLPKTKALLEKSQESLKNDGRILFRYSGTEMKLRLLVESSDKNICEIIAEKIISQYKAEAQIN